MNNPFGDEKNYKKSSDVAYSDEVNPADRTVVKKLVYIDATSEDGIAKGITLSNPNYEVVLPVTPADKQSRIKTEAVIYPRSLANATVTCKLNTNKVHWRAEGYYEGVNKQKDIYVDSITDVSNRTTNYSNYIKDLVEGTDFIVNPNEDKFTEVEKTYNIVVTGQGNYMGTIRPEWVIERAAREITVTVPDNMVYNGSPYVIGAGTGDFQYVIQDTDNTINITNDLEEGSNLKITYCKADDSDSESYDPPKDAGDYKVKISVKETNRYKAYEVEAPFTIHKVRVDLKWHCQGEPMDDPTTMEYNGTERVFSAEVTNAVEGETVTVGGIKYTGNAYNGTAYHNSEIVPKEACANYSVKATTVSDDKNYTLDANGIDVACPAHTYQITQKEVEVDFHIPEDNYTYDATSHIPDSIVTGIIQGTDQCIVSDYSLSGTDVFGTPYSKGTGAVNVNAQNSEVTITAVAIDNANYILTDNNERKTATYQIKKYNLSGEDVKVGNTDNHDGCQLWADKLNYTGAMQKPRVMWVSGDGVKELKNDAIAYPVGYTGALVDGYRADPASNIQALEYNAVERVIKITGINNFEGEAEIPWNIDKLKSSIRILNYDGKVANPFTYGDDLPEITYTYDNKDISNDIETPESNYIEYLYTSIGNMKNGKPYNDTIPPTQAGKYKVTITLKETDHYELATDTKEFVIAQKEVNVNGIDAVDKLYDGTNTATLNFKNSTWTGVGTDISDADKTKISTALANEPGTGFVSYNAEFQSKDVNWGNHATTNKREIVTNMVTISDLKINEEGSETPDILYNFKIVAQGSQKTADNAKITQRELVVSGVEAYDKVYNGSKEAVLNFNHMKINDGTDEVVNAEMIDVNMTGEYKDDGTLAGKDVKLDADNTSMQKKIKLKYSDDDIISAGAGIETANYKIKTDSATASENSQTETQSKITPATLTIKGLKAVDRVYDGTTKVELDWSKTTVEGACTVDVIRVDIDANSAARSNDNFKTADVAYNKNNKVTEKTGIIKNSDYTVVLTGNHRPENYTIADVVFTGTITPKVLNGIAWSYNEATLAELPENSRYVCGSSHAVNNEKLAQIPKATFDADCGLVGDDECAPVVNYYDKEDQTFANAIQEAEIEVETETETEKVDENTNEKIKVRTTTKTKLDPRLYTPINYLEDNGEYVAKVVSVTNGNYIVDDADEHITCAFRYDSDSDASDLTITNYQKSDNGKVFTVTYGEELPEIDLSYTNTDIAGENKEAKAAHFTYLYTGKALNGDNYEDSKPPVQAGSYKVTVTLEETAHFKSSEAQAAFVIAPRTITILQGVSVEDKIYNGTDKATLNFKKVVFDDVVGSDEAEFNTIFASGSYIQYNASFASKNVYYAENVDVDGETEDQVSGQDVTVRDYSFIYHDGTPAVLYNYTLAKDGNVSLLNGKIMPKSVKVTGITAKDKTYDGNDKAVLTTAKAEFAGKLKGDSLDIEASGSYQVTDTEKTAADVLMDTTKGVACAKKVQLDSLKLIPGDETTIAGNYVIANASYEEELSAKILPKSITIKNGLKAKDKVYNASTVAAIDFSEVIFNGVAGTDAAALKELISGDESKHIAYDAEFASKDVAYETSEGGDRTVADVKVSADDYFFVIDETTPQIMQNYVIATEGNQTELIGKIMPRPVMISGIEAKDKIYDGTDKADIDVSNVELDGKFKGDLLKVKASGSFKVTGDETNAADVIVNAEGAAGAKNVALDTLHLVAGDEETIVDNYRIADESKAEAIKLQAKILPKTITVKEGLKVKDKVYDASTDATIDFTDVVFDGAVADDAAKLIELVNGEDHKHIAYKAEFVSKDVAYDTSDQKVAEVPVSAESYAFIIDETTPQIMKNYVIAAEGNQTELKGKITPKPVTVSGIKAKDKTYDGTDAVTLDLSGIAFDGKLEGDSLKVSAKGAFVKTEQEKAEEVLYTSDGNVGKKKVEIVISDLAADNETTIAGNYYLAKEGQQTETEAVINPIEITPSKWSIDETTQLPVIVEEENSEKASVDNNAKAVVNYYEQSDSEFKNPIAADKLVAGEKYVARIEGYSDSNCQVADEYKAVTYTFTYKKKADDQKEQKTETKTEETTTKQTVTPAPATEAVTGMGTEKAPSKKVMAVAVLDLDRDLLASAKGNKLTFKWGQAREADGYNVYITTKKGSYKEPVKLTGAHSYTYQIKNQKKYYYMYVEAFKIVNGEETVLGKSRELVWAGSKTKGSNATVVKVSKKKITLAVNKMVSANASIKVTKKGDTVNNTQTIKGKKAKLVYWSTNKKIATVSSNGKIKGVKTGSCYIYVMAEDGKKQKIKVTVK